MSSYSFNNGGYGSYGYLSRASIGSSVVLVPQQPLLTNPFGLMDPPQEVEVEARDSSVAAEKNKLCARGHWRPTEDAKLKELVAQYGAQNWNSIADHFDGRSGKSCRLRWFNQLDPRIKRGAFTEDEETRLIYAHSLYGNKWALISRLFPGRTDNAVKNHWHVMNARWQREESNYYRRNNPYLLRDLSLNNSVASGLTTTSTINEAASTCTNITLNPSLGTPNFRPFYNYDNNYSYNYNYNYNYNNLGQAENHANGSQMGLSGERRVQTEHVGFGKIFGAWNGSGQIGPIRRPNYSDTNSEVSVGTTTNISFYAENENMVNKSQVHFIDFLGVGDA
ncbi:PREDICTED: myb-like protein AA [Lupinus angustifolius]|uniref:myb-like protein AA n=1 Tax=Lupinus angustifolius TaxID=3871 RepID=UPI00092EA364|nr:PREDICTED: myb-like protein AA [Lupinus angustifolius]